MERPEIDLTEFQLRLENYTGDRAAYEQLLRVMSDALALGEVVPNITSVPSHREALGRAQGPCVAHLRIRKAVADKTGNPPREYVEHSFVVVDASGTPVVWSPDLDPVRAGKVPKMLFLTPALVAVPVVEKVKAWLAAHAPPKAARKTKASMKKTERLAAEGPLRGMAFSPDGTAIAAVDDRATVVIWDAASGALKARKKIAGDGLRSVRELVFSPDGTRIAAGHSSLAVLDAATAEIIEKRAAHPEGEICGLAWRGARIATASDSGLQNGDHRVAIWTASTGALEQEFALDSPMAVAFDQPGNVVYALSSQRAAGAPDAAGETRLYRLALASGERVERAMSASTLIALSDSVLVAEGRLVRGGGHVAFLDPTTLETRSSLRMPEGVDLGGWSGRELVGHDERELIFIEPKSGAVRRVALPPMGDPQARIRKVVVADDTSRLAVAIGRWVVVLTPSGEVVLAPE